MIVLIADDDITSRRLLESLLIKWGYEVVSVTDGNEAWEIIQRNDTNLAILDWIMPGMSGVEICKRARRLKDKDYKYIILITSKDEPEDIIKGMEAGADDYIIKPFDPQELKVRLKAGVRIIELKLDLIKAREALRYRATYDFLTGLLNRHEIINTLERELEKGKRESAPLCIIIADIDHFKNINDKYGHIIGDEVLKELAKRMSEIVRPYDRIGRYGGEEFIIVLPNSNRLQGEEIAERIRLSIANKPIDTAEGMIYLTLSLGIASTDEIHVSSLNGLIRASDIALYRAKDAGRNCVKTALKSDFNPS